MSGPARLHINDPIAIFARDIQKIAALIQIIQMIRRFHQRLPLPLSDIERHQNGSLATIADLIEHIVIRIEH